MTSQLAVETHLIDSTLRQHQTLEISPKGRTLFHEGEEPHGVYMIHSGAIDLIFSAKDGRTKPLRVAHAGQIIGLSAVFSHRRHDYTATVSATTSTGFIDAATFHRLLQTSPAMMFGILQLLSEDVNSCYDCMREIAVAR